VKRHATNRVIDALVGSGAAILLATAGCASTTTAGRTAATPDARLMTSVPPAGPQTAASTTANSSAPAPDTRIGCTRATLPAAWRPGEQQGINGWTRDPVPGADGVPVSPFISAIDLPQDADPIDVLTNAPPLQRMRTLFGDGRDYPLPHSIGHRGYSVDPEQGNREHLVYVLITGCADGRSQMVIMDTTSDTEKQVDGEFRGILQSMTVAEQNAKR